MGGFLMIQNLENKITIILITHRLSTVKDFDTIFLLDGGQLKDQGSYQKLRQSSAIFKKMSKITVYINIIGFINIGFFKNVI